MWGLNLATLKQRLETLSRNRHVQYGVPFVGLLILGSFVIKNFASVRYEFRKQKAIVSPEDIAEATGIPVRPKEERSIEFLYAEHVEKIDGEDDDYEMVRGPRPWEPHPQADKVKEKTRIKDII